MNRTTLFAISAAAAMQIPTKAEDHTQIVQDACHLPREVFRKRYGFSVFQAKQRGLVPFSVSYGDIVPNTTEIETEAKEPLLFPGMELSVLQRESLAELLSKDGSPVDKCRTSHAREIASLQASAKELQAELETRSGQ